MTAGVLSLVEFLLARIAEDEAVARVAIGSAAFQRQTGRWVFEKVRDQFGEVPIVFAVADGGAKTQAANLEAAWERDERGAHIARHDPARVLAECEAKRRIVERCRWAEADPKAAGDMEVAGQWEDAMDNLYDLASVYADHPDYRDEWKP